MRRNTVGWIITGAVGFWLMATAAYGEKCLPHLTCASTPPTANLQAPKVTAKMCDAEECINDAFDIFDAAIAGARGGCFRLDNIETLVGSLEFLINFSATTWNLTGALCHCYGTCTTKAEFILKDRAGNTITPSTVLTCGSSTANDTIVLIPSTETDRAILPGEGIAVMVNNAPGPAGDDYVLCLRVN